MKTPEQMTRGEKLALIYRHTHKDFKSHGPNGSRTILVHRKGQGTCIVLLTDLTDTEIADKLARAIRAEEKRLAKKAGA